MKNNKFKSTNNTIKKFAIAFAVASTALMGTYSQAADAGPGFLALGKMQQGGFYTPGAPYYNMERVPEGSSIEQYQRGIESDIGQYFTDWNSSLAGPEQFEEGYKSGYSANGGDKLGKMMEQARGAINEDGSVTILEGKTAPTFPKVMNGEEVTLNQPTPPKMSAGEKVKAVKEKREQNNKLSDTTIINKMNR